ncbi:RNA pseudouridine synthase [Massilia agilis]|uniref:Dual-specificity RNA pseudouridine synthase RluF n=1 Tax=Massilia agilis TaxID=1811226 RepID=A0ABT2D6T4_9BURK|nr:RNA pseudouridine synthase [Massilia agilis]MCS0807024.1 RNA pseudouridine synthase [Massilia agilis]
MTDEGVRLAKRVATLVPCSRAEAERYIAGGWVSVDGVVVEDPATRVTDTQAVQMLQGATAVDLAPVTILLHKPAGFACGGDGRPATDCLTPENLEGRERFLKRHLAKLTLAVPLETGASGLVVYTQNYHVARKLVDEADRFEHEYVADVTGKMPEGGLALLNRGLTFEGKATGPLKASWQSENRLRFAGKGFRPGQVEHMCRAVGLNVVALKRLRIGRVPLAGLAEGRWRYLGEFERF